MSDADEYDEMGREELLARVKGMAMHIITGEDHATMLRELADYIDDVEVEAEREAAELELARARHRPADERGGG